MARLCNVGLRLRELRHHAGLSQEELAARAEVDRKTVSRIESGHYSATWGSIVALFQILDIHPCLHCKNCLADNCSISPPSVPNHGIQTTK